LVEAGRVRREAVSRGPPVQTICSVPSVSMPPLQGAVGPVVVRVVVDDIVVDNSGGRGSVDGAGEVGCEVVLLACSLTCSKPEDSELSDIISVGYNKRWR
jgi:hypothetical protein